MRLSPQQRFVSRLKAVATEIASLAAEAGVKLAIEKQVEEATPANLLQQFLSETCHEVPGLQVKLDDFYRKFHEWLPREDRGGWSRQRIIQGLPARLPYGKGSGNFRYIGNLSFDDKPPQLGAKPFIVSNGRLVK